MENLDTKQRIFQISKKMFYEMGYHHASLQSIAKELNISHSVIFHHYKNKKDLLTQVVKSYHQSSEAIINELNLDLNILEMHILIHKLSMLPLMQDKKLFRLIYDCILEDVTGNIFSDPMKGTMQRMKVYRNKQLDETEYILLFNTFIGLSKEFTANLYRGSMPQTEDSIDKFLVYLVHLLFQAPKEDIKEAIKKMNDIIQMIHYHKLQFTIIQDPISNSLTDIIEYEFYDYFKVDFFRNILFDGKESQLLNKYTKVIVLTKSYELSSYLNISELFSYLNDFTNKSEVLYELIKGILPNTEFLPIINRNNLLNEQKVFEDFDDYNINVLRTLERMNIRYSIDEKRYTFVFFILY